MTHELDEAFEIGDLVGKAEAVEGAGTKRWMLSLRVLKWLGAQRW